MCLQCVSGEHQERNSIDNMEVFTTKQETMKRDLQELEGFIYPEYQKAASNIIVQKNNAKKTHSKDDNSSDQTRRSLTQRN